MTETTAEKRARINQQAAANQRANDERTLARLASTHEGRVMLLNALNNQFAQRSAA